MVRPIYLIGVGTGLSLLDHYFTSCLLRHVGHQLLFFGQQIVTVRMRVRVRRAVLQIGKQVALVIVRTKLALLLLQRVNPQDCRII